MDESEGKGPDNGENRVGSEVLRDAKVFDKRNNSHNRNCSPPGQFHKARLQQPFFAAEFIDDERGDAGTLIGIQQFNR